AIVLQSERLGTVVVGPYRVPPEGGADDPTELDPSLQQAARDHRANIRALPSAAAARIADHLGIVAVGLVTAGETSAWVTELHLAAMDEAHRAVVDKAQELDEAYARGQ